MVDRIIDARPPRGIWSCFRAPMHALRTA